MSKKIKKNRFVDLVVNNKVQRFEILSNGNFGSVSRKPLKTLKPNENPNQKLLAVMMKTEFMMKTVWKSQRRRMSCYLKEIQMKQHCSTMIIVMKFHSKTIQPKKMKQTYAKKWKNQQLRQRNNFCSKSVLKLFRTNKAMC